MVLSLLLYHEEQNTLQDTSSVNEFPIYDKSQRLQKLDKIRNEWIREELNNSVKNNKLRKEHVNIMQERMAFKYKLVVTGWQFKKWIEATTGQIIVRQGQLQTEMEEKMCHPKWNFSELIKAAWLEKTVNFQFGK